MAVTLQVPLTDAEQAKIVKVAESVNPDATPLQIKKWAEEFMKNALRDEVMRLAIQEAREAANTARRLAEEEAQAGWVE